MDNIENPRNYKISIYEENGENFLSLMFNCDYDDSGIKKRSLVKFYKINLSNIKDMNIFNKGKKHFLQFELLPTYNEELCTIDIEDPLKEDNKSI